ncbi:hypothetical protein ACFLUP_04030 [Chloroflexota bacterium]
MKRCPNCAQEAMRTSDWVCQWCGYPLVSGSYKKIDKTFRELKEERMPQQRIFEEEEPDVSQEPEEELELEDVTQELEVELEEDIEAGTEVEFEEEVGVEPELEPEPEPEFESTPEEVEPEAAAKPRASSKRTTATAKKSTSKSKAATEKKPASKTRTTAETKPAKSTARSKTGTGGNPVPEPEIETAPAAEIEAQTELPPAGMEISVSELLSAYENDMEAADARFANQVMRITGVIDRVEIKDAMNIYFINLISDDARRLLQGVRCVFESKDASALSQLVNGQTVMVQGKFDGSMIDISLKDCRILS